MTNKQIIASYILENQITEPLHTYAMWKQLGYQVKRGEKSKHQIMIWKYVDSKKKNDETAEQGESDQKGKMFTKVASFFTISQVEKIS